MNLRTYTMPEYHRVAMLGFAERVMGERAPDFVLGGYMERWHLAPRGDGPNAYIHRFKGSDSDRALHDHPYDNVTCVLQNFYFEYFHVEPRLIVNDRFLTKPVLRAQGCVVERPAETMHRVAMANDDPVVTLFYTGARIREWGFLTSQGWVKWDAYETLYKPA